MSKIKIEIIIRVIMLLFHAVLFVGLGYIIFRIIKWVVGFF